MHEAMSSRDVPHPPGTVVSRAGSQNLSSVRAALPRSSFDHDYVRRLRSGDPATERHFTSYFGELLSIKFRARLRVAHLVDDFRQETFLRVLTALKSKNCLQSPESLGAFVNAVANNLILELYRRNSQQRVVELEEHYDPPDQRASAESDMVTEERRQQVSKVLDELPLKDREILRMVFYEGADKDEICKLFGVEREYLRVLVHRAKARFRDCLLRSDEKAQADAG
jgi:RNA polymerase sigma-70 factor (ECF subfamily)